MSERFLTIKLADLGDVLTITPALRALRTTYPRARIDVLVTPVGAAALDGLDAIDRVIPFEKSPFDRLSPALGPVIDALRLGMRLRGERYDRVFLFHHLFTGPGRIKYRALLAATGAPWRAGLGETRPTFLSACARDCGYGVRHEADYWLDVAGLAGVHAERPRLEMAIGDSARREACRLLGDSGDPPARRVALYPGAGAYSKARRWPGDRFAEVGRHLADRSANHDQTRAEIVVVGGADERELAETIASQIGPAARSLAGQTSLKVLGAVLERCDLFVGNDGGVMHVAVAVGTPVVAIFGPSNAQSWGPYGGVRWQGNLTPAGRPIVVARDLLCSPCLYRGFLPGTPRGCRARDCLMLTSVATVLDAASFQLNGRRRSAPAER
jgi:heptosyltransferase-2